MATAERSEQQHVRAEEQGIAGEEHARPPDAVREPPDRHRQRDVADRGADVQQREVLRLERRTVFEREVDERVGDGEESEEHAHDEEGAEVAIAEELESASQRRAGPSGRGCRRFWTKSTSTPSPSSATRNETTNTAS